ncbi:MAG: hypothetical protein ACYSU0_18390 [Planctomycetota bacterium]|jgi:hypothetical protein
MGKSATPRRTRDAVGARHVACVCALLVAGITNGCQQGRGTDTSTATRVFLVLEEADLDRLVVFENIRLVRQGVMEFQKHSGAYRFPYSHQTWFEIAGTNANWSGKVLFDLRHVTRDWRLWTREDEKLLVVRVEEHPPQVYSRVVRSGDPPTRWWVFGGSGEREALQDSPIPMRQAAGGMSFPAPGEKVTHLPRRVSQVRVAEGNASVAALPNVRFDTHAPCPLTPGRYRGRPRFSMWENAGRPRCPRMRYFRGSGLRVTVGATEKLYDRAGGLPSDRVSTVLILDKSTICVGLYDACPVQLDLRTGKVSKMQLSGRPSDTSLIEATRRHLWVGTFSEGLYVADRETLQGARVQGIPDCRISDLAVDQMLDNTVWAATSVGLFVIELQAAEAKDPK